MDPRLRKLRVALWILGLGTLLAIAWHGWQGWVLGRGYPDNSYVYVRQSHFTDWTGVVQFSALPTPYAHQFAFYFPATYLLFRRGWQILKRLQGAQRRKRILQRGRRLPAHIDLLARIAAHGRWG